MSMEVLNKLIFTSAVPIVVQFGGYGFFAALLCLLFGFFIEVFLISKTLHMPYRFVFKRLLVAHGIAFLLQIVLAIFAAIVLGISFVFAGNVDHNFFYQGWVILTLIMVVVIIALSINMLAQYYVLRWKNDAVSAKSIKKAVIYAGVINYVFTIGFLFAVDYVSPLLKNNHMQALTKRAGMQKK